MGKDIHAFAEIDGQTHPHGSDTVNLTINQESVGCVLTMNWDVAEQRWVIDLGDGRHIYLHAPRGQVERTPLPFVVVKDVSE